MRGRLAFALTAATMLFLLEGLNVMMATLFATTSQALHPRFMPMALLPALLPVAALFAPMLPVARLVERRGAIAGAAALAAVARVPMCLPQHTVRLITAALVVAAAAIFLSSAVGFLERRSVAGGMGAAILLDQLARLTGWSWDITLRSFWLVPQLGISLAVVIVAASWVRMPMPDPSALEYSMERRAGGLRLRGALALGLLLFLDINVLGRAEVAARWLGVRYEAAAVILVGAAAVATLLLLAGHGPIGRGRRAAVGFAAFATVVVLAAPQIAASWAILLFAVAHAMALLLIGRALVPAAGRREGSTMTAGLILWLLANALYSFTFYPTFTFPWMRGAAPVVFAGAGVLLFLIVALLPRAIQTPAPLQGRIWVALVLVAALSAAGLLAIRHRPVRPDTPVDLTLSVATFNVHQGFSERWRYDPSHIMLAIEAANPDVIALQEVGAGLPMAYGTDLLLYLSRAVGVRTYFAPTHNGLMGDALLTRVDGIYRGALALPPARAEPKVGMVFDVPSAAGTVRLVATRLGLGEPEQAAQMSALLRLAAPDGRAVLMGDFNAEEGGAPVRLAHAAGFTDAFLLAGTAPLPTATAHTPQRRVDWVLVRGLAVESARVLEETGSDHRMVTATLRVQ